MKKVFLAAVCFLFPFVVCANPLVSLTDTDGDAITSTNGFVNVNLGTVNNKGVTTSNGSLNVNIANNPIRISLLDQMKVATY